MCHTTSAPKRGASQSRRLPAGRGKHPEKAVLTPEAIAERPQNLGSCAEPEKGRLDPVRNGPLQRRARAIHTDDAARIAVVGDKQSCGPTIKARYLCFEGIVGGPVGRQQSNDIRHARKAPNKIPLPLVAGGGGSGKPAANQQGRNVPRTESKARIQRSRPPRRTGGPLGGANGEEASLGRVKERGIRDKLGSAYLLARGVIMPLDGDESTHISRHGVLCVVVRVGMCAAGSVDLPEGLHPYEDLLRRALVELVQSTSGSERVHPS